jgi:hypothetical protein
VLCRVSCKWRQGNLLQRRTIAQPSNHANSSSQDCHPSQRILPQTIVAAYETCRPSSLLLWGTLLLLTGKITGPIAETVRRVVCYSEGAASEHKVCLWQPHQARAEKQVRSQLLLLLHCMLAFFGISYAANKSPMHVAVPHAAFWKRDDDYP